MTVRVLTVGDNVVDCYPEHAVMFPGGNAVNVAVHARRCGSESAYVGAVGTDPAGDTVRRALLEENVDCARLRVIPGPNAYAVVHVIDGNRVFGEGDVGVSRFVLDEADLELARSAAIVHTGDCSSMETQLPALAAASRRLSFDFAEKPWPYIRDHAAYADIAVISRPGYSPQDALTLARQLQKLGPHVVAVTLGATGAVVCDGQETARAMPPQVNVVDTLGAGDAFIARLLTGLANGENLPHIVAAATAYATNTCAFYGAFGHPNTVKDGTIQLDPTPEGAHHHEYPE